MTYPGDGRVNYMEAVLRELDAAQAERDDAQLEATREQTSTMAAVLRILEALYEMKR